MKKILLFIPMYNCEKQIIRVLNQIDKNNEKYLSEVIIVNNRSTDNGEQVVTDYLKNSQHSVKISLLKNNQNYGLGGSHKVAFDYAIKNNFDYVIVLHGDDQGRLNDVIPVIESNQIEKYDCMLGSRFMRGSKLEGYSKFRTFGNRIYNVIFSLILFKSIKDLGSGLNIYSTKMLKDKFYFKFADNLTFNCYMLEGANFYKHKIKFFPISWREDDQVSNVKMVNQAVNTLKMLFSYFFDKEKFIKSELRSKIIEDYSAEVTASNKGE